MRAPRPHIIACMSLVAAGMFMAGFFLQPLALSGLVLAIGAARFLKLQGPLKWPLIIVLSLTSFFAGGLFADTRAEAQANHFCGQFSNGDEFKGVVQAAQGEGQQRLRDIRPDEVWVGYLGASVFSRHFCIIRAQNGMVESRKYLYLD